MDDVSQFFIPVTEPNDPELSSSISVYRFKVRQEFNRTEILDLISTSNIGDSEFGITYQWPQTNHNLRTLWAKLKSQTVTFVNNNGEYVYYQLHRRLANSSVVEFFDDEGEVGMLIFGGGYTIQRELQILLQQKFGRKQIDQQQLNYDDIREILPRYERKIRKINIDPSSDLSNWGGTRDAIMSSKGKLIDPQSTIMHNIRTDKSIIVKGFKSFEQNVEVDGMQSAIEAGFDIDSHKVTIEMSRFSVSDALLINAETIMYDFAKEVYSRVISKGTWITKQSESASQLSLELVFNK